MTASGAGAVLYAKNVTVLRRFYQSLLKLNEESVHVAADHIAIGTPTFQLVVWPVERQWNFGDHLVCDARDPEGNVIQLCEVPRS